MSQLEAWALLYLILWTVAGHVALVDYLRWRKRSRRRSRAGQKAAGTRKQNARLDPDRSLKKRRPAGATPKSKPMPEDRVVQAESAWFRLDADEPEPDYNEIDPTTWRPRVRRFDGTALEYSHRDDPNGNV